MGDPDGFPTEQEVAETIVRAVERLVLVEPRVSEYKIITNRNIFVRAVQCPPGSTNPGDWVVMIGIQDAAEPMSSAEYQMRVERIWP